MSGLETALLVGGGIMKAVGFITAGQAAANQAEFDAQVADNNAIAARQQAEADETQRRKILRLDASSRRANLGASGIGLEGSPLDIFEDEAVEAELDVMNIRRTGLMREQGFASQADADRARASAARTGGFIGAGAALLNTGSRATSGFAPVSSTNSNSRRLPIRRSVLSEAP